MLNTDDYEEWKGNFLRNAGALGSHVSRIARTFCLSRNELQKLTLNELVHDFDFHVRSIDIALLSDQNMSSLLNCSVATIKRARAPIQVAARQFISLRGRPKKLSTILEPSLILWIKTESEKGLHPSRKDVTIKAQELIRETDPDVEISRYWIDSFLRSEASPIKQETLKPLETERYDVKKESIEDWIKLLTNIGMIDIDPSLMLNIDETGFGSSTNKSPQPKKVIMPRDIDPEPFYRVPRALSHVSAICSIAANGEMTKIGLIHKNKTLAEDSKICTFYGRSIYYSSSSAFITADIFEDYIEKSVLPYIEAKRENLPHDKRTALILVDGHKTHFTHSLNAKLASLDILYVCMPPHSSHLLQPLDRYFFSVVKGNYKYMKAREHLCEVTANLDKIFRSLQMANNIDTIITSFTRAGIEPQIIDGEIKKVFINRDRLISQRTGEPLKNPEDYDQEIPPQPQTKQKRIQQKSSVFGLWNEEELERKRQGDCPMCGAHKNDT